MNQDPNMNQNQNFNVNPVMQEPVMNNINNNKPTGALNILLYDGLCKLSNAINKGTLIIIQ